MSNIGNKQTMAENLTRYVESSGKTQKELAEIAGVAPSTFSDWMAGKKYPRIDKIELLANYWGILKSDLIEEKSDDICKIPMPKYDPVIIEIIDLLAKLSSEEKDMILYIMRKFASQHDDK